MFEKEAPTIFEIDSHVTNSRYFYFSGQPIGAENLRLYYGGYEQCLPDYKIDRADFPHYCLEVVIEGSGIATANGATYRLSPGIAYLYSPGHPWNVTVNTSEPLKKYFIVFDFNSHSDALTTGLLKCAHILNPLFEFLALVESLEQEAIRPSKHRERICAHILQTLLLKICSSSSPAGTRRDNGAYITYLSVTRIIEENFLELKTASDIAHVAGLNTSYLCRLFKRFGELTPHQFLLQAKMNFATTLLSRDGFSVKRVASELGFDSPYNFSRTFKSVRKLPPSAFKSPSD